MDFGYIVSILVHYSDKCTLLVHNVNNMGNCVWGIREPSVLTPQLSYKSKNALK